MKITSFLGLSLLLLVWVTSFPMALALSYDQYVFCESHNINAQDCFILWDDFMQTCPFVNNTEYIIVEKPVYINQTVYVNVTIEKNNTIKVPVEYNRTIYVEKECECNASLEWKQQADKTAIRLAEIEKGTLACSYTGYILEGECNNKISEAKTSACPINEEMLQTGSNSDFSDWLIYVVILAGVGVAWYFWKKNKKQSLPLANQPLPIDLSKIPGALDHKGEKIVKDENLQKDDKTSF